MIGQTISHYKILEKLGEGGMGVVYKAQDTTLDRLVALKFLPNHVSIESGELERFIQEAKAAAGLNHPNICTIYGIEQSEEKHFIAMEFVDGQTLQEKKSSLSMKQALDIGIQIADGLAAAHEKGIVHRDIKPENIMIRKDGRVQIMDFGLAKLRGASRLTKEGSTVGTAGYMSPEQVQGQETDHRSDIFSLGVLLFEMLTGRPPFKGMHETAIAYEVVNVEVPPPTSVKPDLPPELDDIVASCLAKDLEERFQSAAEISRLLKKAKRDSSRVRVRSSDSQPVGPSSAAHRSFLSSPFSRSERWIWSFVSGVLLVSVIFILSSRFSEIPQTRTTIRFLMQPPSPDATIGSLALSPDGTRLAYTANVGGAGLIWVRHLDQLESYSLAGTENASYPFWSPDGRFVAFFAGGKLKKVDISGGAPTVICDAPIGRGGSWGGNGIILFSPNVNARIHQVDASGGIPVAVSKMDTTWGDYEHIWPVLLPDGDHYLYGSRRFDHDVLTMSFASLSTGESRQLIASGGYVCYSPPGYLVYLLDQNLVAKRFDPETGILSGDPIHLEENPGVVPLTGQGAYSVSATGVLATGGGRVESRQYAWFDRTGKLLETVTPPGNFFDIDLSPDGRKGVVQYDVSGLNSDIYVIDLVAKSLTQFTFDPDAEDNPIWSPDGSTILYDKLGISSPSRAYRKRSSGSGSPEMLPYEGRLSDWSNDGRYILFYGVDILYADLQKDGALIPYVATNANEIYGHFSPNGRYVAYSSNESGIFEIYVQSFPETGGKWRISRNGGSQPEWRADGKELFFIAPDRTLFSTNVSTEGEFTFRSPQALFRTQVDDFDAPNRYVVSNDGQKFLINIPAGSKGGNPVKLTVNWPDGKAKE